MFAFRVVVAGPATTVVGVVQDAKGRAIPGVWITREGYRNRTGGVAWWRSGPDGRFRIDGVPEGKLTLRVIPGEANLTSAAGVRVETTAGVADLRVVLDPGPELFLRIEGYVAPPGEPRYARLVWQEPDGRRPVRYAPIRADGWTRFVRLPSDRDLEVWAVADEGHPVRRGGLRTGEDEQRVLATEGRQIRGRLLVASAESLPRVEVSVEAYPHFAVGRAKIGADGSFVVSELPEGAYRVAAWFARGRVTVPVVKSIESGASDVVFDLRE